MSELKLAESVDGPEGYTTALAMGPGELETFQKLIRIQWLYRLQLLAPREVAKFAEGGMADYHHLAHLIEHSSAWPKTARVLPSEAIALLMELPFFQKLNSEFGSFTISDEEEFGWPNIYWRLVRPGSSDIGPIHADKWFWDLGHGRMPDYPCHRVKIWIAIVSEPGKNGLIVIPGSHRRDDWKWHKEEKFGLPKPVFDEDPATLDTRLVDTLPGQAIIFHDQLLHGGAENQADTCRVSAELTMLVRDWNLEHSEH